MQRRGFFQVSTAAAMAVTGLATARANAQSHSEHDHAAMMAAMGATDTTRKYDSIIKPFQDCTAAVQVCIAHCQVLLATGDKSLGPCLRTALDCDVTCGAALKAAGLNSSFTPSLAKTAIAAMEACVKACKPHVDHHAECKGCHDACLVAIEAARKLA